MRYPKTFFASQSTDFVEGKSPQFNRAFTPEKRVFSKQDALMFETEYSQTLEYEGYRVLGDGLTDLQKKSVELKTDL